MAAKSQSVKLVIVGDGAVGKTCVLMSYANKKFPETYIPTVFDNYVVTLTVGHPKEGAIQVELGLWDTAGQEEYDRLRPLSYANASVFLLCFSVMSSVSYENITAKWYPELMHFCPDVPQILVGTKIDLRSDPEALKTLRNSGQHPIATEQGMELAKRLKSAAYVECSAKTGENLKTVFDEAIKVVLFRNKKKEKKCVIL